MPTFLQCFEQALGRVFGLDIDFAVGPLRFLIGISGGILFLDGIARDRELDELVAARHRLAFCILTKIPADDRLFHNLTTIDLYIVRFCEALHLKFSKIPYLLAHPLQPQSGVYAAAHFADCAD